MVFIAHWSALLLDDDAFTLKHPFIIHCSGIGWLITTLCSEITASHMTPKCIFCLIIKDHHRLSGFGKRQTYTCVYVYVSIIKSQ